MSARGNGGPGQEELGVAMPREETLQLDLTGCGHYWDEILRPLKALDGVIEIKHDPARLRVFVRYDPAKLSRADLERAVEDGGYRIKSR